MDEVTTPLLTIPKLNYTGNIATITDNMNEDVTPHIPVSDDVTSRPSQNVYIRSRTAAVKSSHSRSHSPSSTRMKSVTAVTIICDTLADFQGYEPGHYNGQ